MKGPDYASVDNNAAPDAAKVASVSSFVIIRKSYTYYDSSHKAYHLAHDATYARDVDKFRSVGLPVGSYMFPHYGLGAPTPAEQVANFIASPGDVKPGLDLPVFLDVEFTGNGIVDTGRSKEEVFKLILQTLAELKKNFKSVGIYTSHVQWHDTNGLGGPDDPALHGLVLWQKTPYRLAANKPEDTLEAKLPHVGFAPWDVHDYWRVPRPWDKQGYWIQQTQGDCVGYPGFGHTVDLSVWNSLSAKDADKGRTLWLQTILGLTQTGVWNQKTQDALLSFQSKNGLQQDATVGPKTFVRLT